MNDMTPFASLPFLLFFFFLILILSVLCFVND